MFGLGPSELIIVGIVAILLFGKRLPEVAKSLGKSYREFRQGLSEFQSHVDINPTSYTAPPARSYSSTHAPRDVDDYEAATAPKFEPPPSEPTIGDDSQVPSGEIPKHIAEK
jgi:sec-independent protein translocase protein TatA